MSQLKTILKKHLDLGHYLGEKPSTVGPEEIKMLKMQLTKLRNFHSRLFWASLLANGALLAIFIVCMLRGGGSMDWIEKTGAFLGVTFAGLGGAVLKTWKDRYQVDTVLLFARSFERETLNAILAVFLQKL
jgi:hypothetical protein